VRPRRFEKDRPDELVADGGYGLAPRRRGRPLAEAQRREAAGTLLNAAKARVSDARLLSVSGHFVAAHYVAGVAVEALLTAYWVRDVGSIPRDHDVDRLEPRFFYFVPPQDAEATAEHLRSLKLRWENRHRYRDDASLAKWLKERLPKREDRKQMLAESSATIVSAAEWIVKVGIQQWKRRPER